MAEENQVTKEPQQIAKEPQRVTTKDPKKVEVGKRLAAINRKKREEQVQLEKTASRVNQYYGIRAVIALGVIGGLGNVITFIGPRKKGREKSNLQTHNKIILNHTLRLTSLRWIKSLLYYKYGQEEYSKWPISSSSYISASGWLFSAWKENIGSS